MAEMPCDGVKYSYRDTNQEMWKNSKKLTQRIGGKYSLKERDGVFELGLKQVGRVDQEGNVLDGGKGKSRYLLKWGPYVF